MNMRAKLLFAALFVALLWLGLMSFGSAQESPAPLPLEVSSPAAACPASAQDVPAPASTAEVEDASFTPQLPVRAHHAPTLYHSYYRTAYQAFYLSGSAG